SSLSGAWNGCRCCRSDRKSSFRSAPTSSARRRRRHQRERPGNPERPTAKTRQPAPTTSLLIVCTSLRASSKGERGAYDRFINGRQTRSKNRRGGCTPDATFCASNQHVRSPRPAKRGEG